MADLAHAGADAGRRGDAVNAWSDIPWYLLTICVALIAAVIVGFVFVFRDIRRDIDDGPP